MDQSNGSPAANNTGAAAETKTSPTKATTPGATDKNGAPKVGDFGFDFLATQNGGQFDPTLFGDYRESQAAIVGDGDFTSGFFNEAFPFPDMASPFSFGSSGLTPAQERKNNPMDLIDKIQNGDEDDEVVPGEAPGLSCHQIW